MRSRALGDVLVSAIGLGAMHFSFSDPPDDHRSIATIHAAIDAGITLIDTALAYTTMDLPAHNEWLVGRALRAHPRGQDVLVATKGGHWRAGVSDFPVDGRRGTLRANCEQSLRALGVDTIGLYQLHWPDPKTPITESIAALRELQDEGKIVRIGVCNVSLSQLIEARSVATIASVQNRFSIFNREDRVLLDYCATEHIAYLAYSPLGGKSQVKSIDEQLPAFAAAARELGVSIPRLSLAWLLAQSPTIIPIPGTRRAEAIIDSAAAADLDLSTRQLAALNVAPSPR